MWLNTVFVIVVCLKCTSRELSTFVKCVAVWSSSKLQLYINVVVACKSLLVRCVVFKWWFKNSNSCNSSFFPLSFLISVAMFVLS